MSKCLEIFALKKDIKMILLREFKDHKTVLIYNFLHTCLFLYKKLLPKCVLGHLESFKTHFFWVKNGGCPYFWAFLADFGQNFMNFANFSKYFEILGGKRKKIFFDRCA